MAAGLVALVVALLASGPVAPDDLVPPRPTNALQHEMPAGATTGGRVVVKIVVGTDGVPHSAVVEASVSPELDAEALRAASALRYEPATYEGKPVEVILRVAVDFAAPAPEVEPEIEPEPETAPTALARELGDSSVTGRIRVAGERTAIHGAHVIVVPADPTARVGPVRRRADMLKGAPAWQRDVESADDGAFRLGDLPAGKVRVVVVATGHERFEAIEELGPRETLEVAYYLQRSTDNPYRTVVKTTAGDREEVARRTITPEEITNLPGTQGDALKSVQNFPGMARAPFGIGLLVIRGADPTDSAVYLGEHRIPQLFHFGGLTSVFNADIVTNIDFIPGNFDARFGEAIGGVIDVKTRPGRRDGVHGYIDADLFDAGFLLEAPVGKGSIVAAARRSYIDAILPLAIPDDAGIGLTLAPRYYDYQLLFDYPISHGRLTARVFGSDDRTKLVAADPNEVSSDERDRFETTLVFHRVDLAYENHREGWDILVTPSYRYDFLHAGAGGLFRATVTAHQFSGRAEIGRQVTKRVRFDIGTQLSAGVLGLDAESPPVPQASTGSTGARFSLDSRNPFATPSLYATLRIDAHERLTLIPSVRFTYWARQFRRGATDPRLRFVVQLAKRSKLRGGVGLYSQIPDLPEWNPQFGNPNVAPERALHTSLSFVQELPRSWSVELAAFYKYSWDLASPSTVVVRRDDGEVGLENFASRGRGRIVGGELFVRKQLSKKLFGWLAYTVSRSERLLPDDARTDQDDWFLFDFDQTHVLTAIAVYRLPRNWQVGARFRVVSGNPYTPHVGAAYDASTGDYVAFDGPRNSRRVAAFHQLDLRVDKRFVWRKVMLEAYVDVQNVYNHQNVEFMQDSFDFTQSRPIASLPILPSLGLRLQW
jgi:TonB family protein